jgi:NADPH:quinone reductase-like Zn-dependent oxidoreductase
LSHLLHELAPDGIDGYIDTFGSGNVALAISLGVQPHRINTLIDQEAVQRFGVHSEAQEQADTPRIWGELADLVARKSITVPIAAVYDLTTEQVRKAYHDVAARHVGGKRVLRIMPADVQAAHT